MGPLVVLTKILSAKDFALYSGIVMGLGGLGALFATEPFFYIVSQVGWGQLFTIFIFNTFFNIFVVFIS